MRLDDRGGGVYQEESMRAFEVKGNTLEQRTAMNTGQEAQLDHNSVFSVQHQAGTGTAVQWEAFLQA